MGLFGNKKPDPSSFDALRAEHQPPMASPPVAYAPEPAPAPSVVVATQEPLGPYGIEEAIRLLRTLPVSENADLVMRVVRGTLESMHVHVTDILQDADRKEVTLRERIGVLKSAINEFEQEIQVRREEISRLEVDLAETSGVRTRLTPSDESGALRLPRKF